MNKSLRLTVDNFVDALEAGRFGDIHMPSLLKLLKELRGDADHLDKTVAVTHDVTDVRERKDTEFVKSYGGNPDRFQEKKEGTPIRVKVQNWKLGACKRCLANGVKDDDIVVKIFGLGWWHDNCYRHVNPLFYTDLNS